jgi:hypothetical protein
MMKSSTATYALLAIAASFVTETRAFAPKAQLATKTFVGRAPSTTKLNVFDEKERQSLTRDTEPEDYFQT